MSKADILRLPAYLNLYFKPFNEFTASVRCMSMFAAKIGKSQTPFSNQGRYQDFFNEFLCVIRTHFLNPLRSFGKLKYNKTYELLLIGSSVAIFSFSSFFSIRS